MLKAVLFDLDGTLVDSFKSIVLAFNESLNLAGMPPVAQARLGKRIGTPYDKIMVDLYPELADDPGLLKDMSAEFNKRRHELTEKYTRAYPGVRDTLEKIKNLGLKTCVVTTTHRDMTEKMLNDTKIDPFIELIISRDDVKKLKPDPEPLFLAMEKMGVVPGECVMVGDHPNDILAAKNAGLRVVIIPKAHKKESLIKYNPDYLIDNSSVSFNELYDLLRKIT